MQEQVFLNEAAPARIDAVASDLSLSRKAILQEASYRYLEGLEWQAEIKAGRDDAAQGNIPLPMTWNAPFRLDAPLCVPGA